MVIHDAHNASNFADVILPLPLQALSYRVPLPHQKTIHIGSGVLVPLRKNKLVLAIVLRLHNETPPYVTKEIVAIPYPESLYTFEQLLFMQWIAAYYMANIGDVLSIGLPKQYYFPNNITFQIKATIAKNPLEPLDETAQTIMHVLQTQSLHCSEIYCISEKKIISKALIDLLCKGFIEAIPKTTVHKIVKNTDYIMLAPNYSLELAQTAKLTRSANQKAIINYFLSTHNKSCTTQANLLEKGYTKSAITSLLSKGILVYQRPIFKTPLQPLVPLTDKQQQALAAIQEQFTHKAVVLLHGVVGSGKTLIYMHLIQEVLQKQKKVLLLLPEISLITHMATRLNPFWGPWLTLYHSKQSPKERLKSWEAVKQQSALLMVGTRSAIFLPFKELALIIVDEEHDTAYKQTDSSPAYHARDSSIVLAKQHQATVLLGSGTPSIESYYNAQSGKFGLVTLSHRFGLANPPSLHFIDIKIEEKQQTIQTHFATTLLDALKQTIQQGGQAMVFQNQRGYAKYLICATCRWVPRCLFCSVSLTYHQTDNHLLCHYCSYTMSPFEKCNNCGSEQLHNRGSGTEKIVETLQLIFPEFCIARMDSDSTKKKKADQTILDALSTGSIDILVGTQLIAKGLDFPNIHLIGVLDIDGLLHFPDFRANEKCFQLITQLAGRAGRGNHAGKVFIQTTQPHHPLHYHLASGNYKAMYQDELTERKQFVYPPYVRLIKLTLSCPDKHLLRSGSIALKKAYASLFGKMVIGPYQPLVEKIRNNFLLELFIKIANHQPHALQHCKTQLQSIGKDMLSQRLYKPIKIAWDVDPV